MLCLSFEILKCFVICMPLLNTQPKKMQQQNSINILVQLTLHALYLRIPYLLHPHQHLPDAEPPSWNRARKELWELSILISDWLIFNSIAGDLSCEPVHTKEPEVQVSRPCPTNLNQFDFVGLVARTKFCSRREEFWWKWIVPGTGCRD